MNVTTTSWTVDQLTREAQKQRLHRRDEYQRGEQWTNLQKQRYIDSIYRGYPVPAIFLHVVKEPDPCDSSIMGSELYIIDGQQRLSALRCYLLQGLAIPDVTDQSKLRLPEVIRNQPSPWTGKQFAEVEKPLQLQFLNCSIAVHLIETDIEEEVRDLFIRLQAGTALSPQQVRDAWPGNLSPFVERCGGKFLSAPHRLFTLIDKRGDKLPTEDEQQRRDLHVSSRQLCAQLLSIFLHQEENFNDIPSVGAKQLDELYHQYAGFPDDGREDQAKRFLQLLDFTAQIVQIALSLIGKRTLPKLEVFSIFMFLQKVTLQPAFEWTPRFARAVGAFVSDYPERDYDIGKRTKASTIASYFRNWRRSLIEQVNAPELNFLHNEGDDSDEEPELDEFVM